MRKQIIMLILACGVLAGNAAFATGMKNDFWAVQKGGSWLIVHDFSYLGNCGDSVDTCKKYRLEGASGEYVTDIDGLGMEVQTTDIALDFSPVWTVYRGTTGESKSNAYNYHSNYGLLYYYSKLSETKFYSNHYLYSKAAKLDYTWQNASHTTGRRYYYTED